MAAPSLTYTLTNGSTADATQVMQNFNDLLNGIADGTKDLSINALTCAGTATLNGHVNIGNAAGDDLTVTASLASTIPIKTTNTYNIGSATLGLAGAYFGTGSTQTARIVAASSFASARTYTLPDLGSAGTFAFLEGAQTFTGLKNFASAGITAPTSAAGNVYSGTYTPTTASASNCNVNTVRPFFYTRVGNLVTVNGQFLVNATASVAAEFFFSLPVASDIAAIYDAPGVLIHAQSGSDYAAGNIYGDASNDRAQATWRSGSDTANREMNVSFMYIVK